MARFFIATTMLLHLLELITLWMDAVRKLDVPHSTKLVHKIHQIFSAAFHSFGAILSQNHPETWLVWTSSACGIYAYGSLSFSSFFRHVSEVDQKQKGVWKELKMFERDTENSTCNLLVPCISTTVLFMLPTRSPCTCLAFRTSPLVHFRSLRVLAYRYQRKLVMSITA